MAVIILALVGLNHPARGQSDFPAFFQTQHRAVLQQWLRLRPQLRLATEVDCVNIEGLQAMRQEYGEHYQPYYAVGDLNGDRAEDFAVALINSQRRARKFAIAVFNGPFSGKAANPRPALYRDGVDLSDGGLVYRPDNLLLAGVFQTNNCIVLRPRGRSYVIKDCL
jgi:hypothetical protein